MSLATLNLDRVDRGLVAQKLDRMRALIEEMRSAAVAFSGGVDSALLLKVAHDVLGARCIAVVAVSESYTPEEADEARELAERIGAECLFIDTRELSDPNYAQNPTNRCYYCKKELFTQMAEVVAARGLGTMLYGANLDDTGDYRPGQTAAREFGVRAPLIEAELTKPEIRELSRQFGLPTWDKPASACLSSRIPYGTPVTAEALNRIADAERVLRRLGFRQLRVRHHSDIARIEVPREEFPRLLEGNAAAQIVGDLKALGYLYVTLDLQGFRSGSMNEALRANRDGA